MQPDYFEIRDAATLAEPQAGARELVILTAARLGKARLIDNLRVMLARTDAAAPSGRARR
jgi:pantoate--beta-alanine ligase